jgi:phosphonatase-like hydrolase
MTLPMRIELAVLDLAGTTVSDPGIVEAAVRRVTGTSFDETVFEAHRGGSKLDMLAALVGSDLAETALTEFEADLLAAIRMGTVEPLPHAVDALARIADAGIKTCLTTGFSGAIRGALIDSLGWDQVVNLTLSPGEGCRGRPWPDLILTAALSLEVSDVSAIAVVGDTSNDVLAARRAGAGIAAAVLTGAHDQPRLDAENPSHLLQHVGQFADLCIKVAARSERGLAGARLA